MKRRTIVSLLAAAAAALLAVSGAFAGGGTAVGSWPARVTPSYIAFEGRGSADDLVVRAVS